MQAKEVKNSQFGLKELLKLDVIIAFLIFAIPIIPAVGLRFPLIWRFILFVIWFFVIRLSSDKKTLILWRKNILGRKREFLWLIFFLFVMYLYYVLVRTSSQGFLMIAHFLIMVFVLLMDSYYSVIDRRYRYAIVFLCVLSLGIQATISIPYFLGGFTLREYLGVNREGLSDQEMLSMADKGISGQYHYASLSMIVFASFALIQKARGILKILIYFSAVTMAFSMGVSSFLAPIALLGIGGVLLIFLLRGRVLKPKVIIPILLFSIVLYFFYSNYLADTPMMGPVTKKIEGFLEAFNSKGISSETDVTGRTRLAMVSIDTFLDNVLFGIGVPPLHSYHLIGEHMPWVDFFAYFGLIGTIPFFVFLTAVLKKNKFKYFAGKSFFDKKEIVYNKIMLTCSVLFLLSNFISPMLTVPTSYIFFLFMYTSVETQQTRQY